MKGLIDIAHAQHEIQTIDLKSNLSFKFHDICIKTFETAIPSHPKINNDILSLRSDFDVPLLVIFHGQIIFLDIVRQSANYIYCYHSMNQCRLALTFSNIHFP